ncbi:hypothetical protein [Allobranchiibius huperziae]|uniref:Htaa domain-containing protein n=1 Tax=Allobranchiibius huperziae TaxID=1874116 RepID=A0A853DEE8_9MICO|nr:hypothetical protein [Allobranchiibius huperziae]NYJ73444.1 hypothetical protein [Allobranchiibius huperziae]
MRSRVITATLAIAVAATTASVALAGPAEASAAHRARPAAASLSGTTTVTTAQGIAPTLLKAGILPLPVPDTRLGLRLFPYLAVSYGFPITGGNPNLSGPSSDILHRGGIDFVSLRGKSLEIGKFDVSLADKKVYATQVNFAAARIPVLDLDFSGLVVKQRNGTTNLSGITARLDPAAAGALNSTFGTALPADGSLVFGSVKVTLKS